MNISPKLSVITATYNDVPYLYEAIDSILSQSYTNFEYIIVDDASTDITPHILAEYAEKDPRIVIHRNEKNLGRAGARNRALELAQGQWIAVFDGDDISHPDRLEKQIHYLQNHPDVDYIGTMIRHINKQTGEFMPERVFAPPLSHGEIYWYLCFNFPFHHSSTMGRREIFAEVGGYPTIYPVCEDISLWMAMANQGTGFANIDEELLTYRVNPKPDYYALNQAVAQQLHRSHITSILKANVSKAVFRIIWYTNLQGEYQLPREVTAGDLVKAISTLVKLYYTLMAQHIFDDDEIPYIQNDLFSRIRKMMQLMSVGDARPQPAHQYTYQLPVTLIPTLQSTADMSSFSDATITEI